MSPVFANEVNLVLTASMGERLVEIRFAGERTVTAKAIQRYSA